jgi:TatD DNase family protein
MIDVHCHLEQKDFSKDRDEVIKSCKQQLSAIITSCAHPQDFDLTLEIVKKHAGFVFCTIGLHPTYIKEVNEKEKNEAIGKIIDNKKSIVGIGEVGLDYYWIKEKELQEKQKEVFLEFIELAKRLELPLVIHTRDATADTIAILEDEGMQERKVLIHLFNEKSMLQRVIDNGWSISIGPGISRSKTIKKIARDCPLDRIMLETDSPWFGFGQRGTPLNVKIAAEKIAEVKKISVAEVERQTDLNAVRFFDLAIK